MNITEVPESTPECLLIAVADTGITGLAEVSFGAASFDPEPALYRPGLRWLPDKSPVGLTAPTVQLRFERLVINGNSPKGFSITYRPYRLYQPDRQRTSFEVLTDKGIRRVEYEVHIELDSIWARVPETRELRCHELCENVVATYLTFSRAKTALAEFFAGRATRAQNAYRRARADLTQAWNELAAIEALDERAPVPGYPALQAQSLQRALLEHAHNTCTTAHWQAGPVRDGELDRTVRVVTDEWERAYDCLRDALPEDAAAGVVQQASENLINIVLDRVAIRLRVAHSAKHICLLGEHTCGLGEVDTFIAIARSVLTTLAASELSTPTRKLRAHW